jgi:hypothetical protein
MNYCSIQEAWGHNNYISKEYNNFEKPLEKNVIQRKPVIQKKTIEKFSNNKIKKFNTNKQQLYCNDFINHLKDCRSCQIKLRDQFRPKILENFEDIIQTNRDIIVLVLVGICIMLFFNILTSTVKEKEK